MIEEEEFYNPLRDKRKNRKVGNEVIPTDMNAMVDLAFLLLTFFMLTTTMLKPKAIEMVMPVSENEEQTEIQAIKESRAMTLIPLSENRLCYFTGFSKAEVKEIEYGVDGIRKILLEHRQNLDYPVVIVKPHPESAFENLVDLIDEMNITRIERYAIGSFGKEEKELLLKSGIKIE